MGCIWWAIGVYEYEYGREAAASGVRLAASSTSSWLLRPNYRGLLLDPHMPLGHRYLSGLYWSLTTLMKASWIGAGSTLEKVRDASRDASRVMRLGLEPRPCT